MKKFCIIIASILCITGVYAQEKFSPADNLYLNLGAGFLVGDNGQPNSISNVATAWDMNIGYWFGAAKYGGLRVGYTGDVLQSFNYLGKKSYGWNTLYLDGMLNLSNLIYRTKTTHNDPRWYCSPFVSVECLIPMAQNQHKTSFGFGVGIANEINIHRNISVTLDWRNTIAMADGAKWLQEVTAGLKFYFTGKARFEKKKDAILQTTDTVIITDCKAQNDSITLLRAQLAELNRKISIIESDTSIYHLEDKVIRDYVLYSCRLPYNQFSVTRAIKIFPEIRDKEMRREFAANQKQLQSYYDLSKQLLDILSARQNQLNSPTFNRNRWERGLQTDLDNYQKNDIARLYYLNDVIEKVLKEAKKDKPDFSEYISELQEAINTKK